MDSTPERDRRRAQLRALYPRTRLAGVALCLAGAALLVGGAVRWDWPHWLRPAGIALVLAGWALFGLVIVRRTAARRRMDR